MVNNSVKKCCICNNKNIGEFITINDNKYHLCCIEDLKQENELLKRNCNIGNENLDFYRQQYKELHNKIDKAIDLYKNCKAEDYCTLDLDMYNALIGGDVDDNG